MAGYLLLESGSKILTEQGVDALLLENATSVVTVVRPEPSEASVASSLSR